MLRSATLAGVFATLCLTAAPMAAAQGSSENETADYFTVEQAANFSKAIEETLAQRGARVALVFRSGRSRADLPEGFSYTHGAFWVYQPSLAPDGRQVMGYSVHNLYSGNGEDLPKSRSKLVQDFPFDFVSGSHEDDIGIIIPSPEVQRRLYQVIASPIYEALHVPDYTLISNPLDARYQNCTEFMLDVLSAAIWETDDYAQIKANLKASFEPASVKDARGLKRMLAPVVDERMRSNDHRGKVKTATFETIAAFMEKYGYTQDVIRLNINET